MLRYRAAKEWVYSMVRIWSFRWLVFQTSWGVLAAENGVSLEGILVKKPFSIHVAIPIHRDIQ